MKTVALIFGRLNPPTTGHRKLIQTLSEQHADEHLVYLSHSQDSKKNPLSYEEKVYFADAFFSKEFPNIDVVETQARTLIEVLQELKEFTNVILVAGGDRIEEFKRLLDKYNGVPDKTGNIPYSFASIDVISAGERDPDADDVSGMSASKLRALAAEGNYEAFKLGVPSDDRKLVKELYDTIRKGMKILERKLREDKASKEQRALIDAQLDALLAAANIPKGREASDLKKVFRLEFEKNPKLTPEEFMKNQRTAKQEEVPGLAEALKVEGAKYAKEQEAKAKAGETLTQKLMGKLKAQMLPGAPLDAPAGVQVYATLAEPTTNMHSSSWIPFMQRAQKSNQLIILAIVQPKSKTYVPKPEYKAVWFYYLAAMANPRIKIVAGQPDQIGRALALAFPTAKLIELNGQASLIAKLQGPISNAYFASGGKLAPSFVAGRQAPVMSDDPNPATEALTKFDKNTEAFLKSIKEDETSKKAEDADLVKDGVSKRMSKVRKLEEGRKAVFLQELPPSSSKELLDGIYYYFSNARVLCIYV